MRLPAPLPDDERTPVLLALDEVLGAAPDAEPPMRNTDGVVAEIRARRPWGLHGLTGAGADAEEAPEDRVPPPEEPLITALDAVGLGLLVERHIEHLRTEKDGQERAVSLPEPFLRAYLGWRQSALPTVRAVVTAPLVTREGGLLAGAGLDRAREVVFRIEPALLALVPADPGAVDDADVVEALRFLLDEWLCDVAAGFAGRVVLLAYALTVVERVLLPERPAFFVTAGQRGGGKTTVVTMVVAAVSGRRPPAAAWSPSAEERRKALLAYLGEGVATLVWDNIERGTAISCPSIEKALTAAEFTDRVLGVSRSATVPSTTVQCFTGNNIAPRGDMASRSLVCRLEVERPDPENRAFRHPDPVGWTLRNRARILRALYILLRWNPQVRASAAERVDSKTRFKAWWDLVGAPLELAAMLACDAQAAAEAGQGGGPFRCAPEPVDFGALFAAGEAEEEETSGMRELVLLLREAFGERLFSAADLAALLQAPAVAAAAAPPTAGRGTSSSNGRRRRRSGRRRCGRRWRARPARRCRRGRRPRRAWSASGCRWWWGGRWNSAAARSGGWPKRMPATRPTPTGWRSRRELVAHERGQKHDPCSAAAPRHSRLSRHSRASSGKAGKPGVRWRWSRRDPGHLRLSGAASDPAELLRRLRARGGGGAGTAAPSSAARAASAGALGGSNPGGPAAAHAPGAAAGPAADSRAAALLRSRRRGSGGAGRARPGPRPGARGGRRRPAGRGAGSRAGRPCRGAAERHAPAPLPRLRAAGPVGLRRGAGPWSGRQLVLLRAQRTRRMMRRHATPDRSDAEDRPAEVEGNRRAIRSPWTGRAPMRRDGEGDAAEAAPRLKEVAGADSDRLNGLLLRAVLGCLPCSAAEAPEDRERRVGAALDAVRGFGPRDAVEGMLAAQAVAMHLAGMAALQRSQRPDLPAEVASRLRRDGAGLCRAMAEMARGARTAAGARGARQVVRVERVVVQEGGQAIVGAVAPPRR